MTIIDDLTLADPYPVWKARIAAAERPVVVDLGTISPEDPHPGVQMLKMWEGVEVRSTPVKKRQGKPAPTEETPSDDAEDAS